MRSKRKILVVDDDEDILDLLKYNLEKEGYEVRIVSSCCDALMAARQFRPDLIILDIIMPGQNGIELCRILRSTGHFKNTYIFFLTACSEPYYERAVFTTGGDDYIQKITGLKALTMKISAVLKKGYVIRKSVTVLTLGALQLNRFNCSIFLDGQEIFLSPPEFDVLFFMAQNSFEDFSINQLIENIWGSEIYLAESHAEVYIQNLKKKLGGVITERVPNHYGFKLQ
jgi:two-component system alkaline phosphatase synthesis response regulator PhoP